MRRPVGIALREEGPGDAAAIRAVQTDAFGRTDEAELVDRLRAEGAVVASLIALEGDGAVGHVLFSRASVHGPTGTVPAAALAPLAVRPDRQRRGIGAALVRRGLALCRTRGVAAVLVLGKPAYYGRFGFTAAAAQAVGGVPWAGHPAFMARVLRPGPAALAGTVCYACAFGLPA